MSRALKHPVSLEKADAADDPGVEALELGDNGVGVQWYGQEVPDYFVPVYQVNTIVIYKYAS